MTKLPIILALVLVGCLGNSAKVTPSKDCPPCVATTAAVGGSTPAGGSGGTPGLGGAGGIGGSYAEEVVVSCEDAEHWDNLKYAEAYFPGRTALELASVVAMVEDYQEWPHTVGHGYYHVVSDRVYVKDEWVAAFCGPSADPYVSVTFVLR